MNEMQKTNELPCPDRDTLLGFVLGKLIPPVLQQCESHVAECESCHETLRGLDANDTLTHYVSQAMDGMNPDKQSDLTSDTQAINGLMQRLMNSDRTPSRPAILDAEAMADRAAEVLRCVEPAEIGDEDSLGTLAEYRLIQLIGAGGTGVVFKAVDTTLNRIVALKVLRPSLGSIARDRFIAEARLAASIEHENVVTIYQIGQQHRLAFIAMQWLPGETLESRLTLGGRMDEASVRDFVRQIASGLQAAHQKQLIHRDIKPANIWICDSSDRIKILDFGLARITDNDPGLTATGMLAGTPNFMSPEQAKGLELDERSDLFSLGCVMYQMLTGKLPFSAPTVLATIQAIQTDSPAVPNSIYPDVSVDLFDLTMSLLEKQTGNRVATASELIQCLDLPREKWQRAFPRVPRETMSALEPKLKVQPKYRWPAVAALVGLLALLVGSGWYFSPQIIRVATDQGELVIDATDENVQVQVLKDGQPIRVLDRSTGASFDIRSGSYEFKAIKEGSDNSFEVTPNTIVMNRGGKQIVKVTKVAAPAADDTLNFPADFGNAEKLKKVHLRQLEKWYALQAEIAELLPSLGSGHPDVEKLDLQMRTIEKMLRESGIKNTNRVPPSSDPIFGGRTFGSWIRIVRNDRRPQTVAEGIDACAMLLEGSKQRKATLLKEFRRIARKHGSNVIGNDGASDIYYAAISKAFNQFEIGEIVEFVQGEIDSGNDRSLALCNLMIGGVSSNSALRYAVPLQKKLDALNFDALPKRIVNKELKANKWSRDFIRKAMQYASVTDLNSIMVAADFEGRSSLIWDSLLHSPEDANLKRLLYQDIFDMTADSGSAAARDQYLRATMTVGSGHLSSWAGSTFSWNGLGTVFDEKNRLVRHKLANKLLIEILEKTIDGEGPEFGPTYSEIWFYHNGLVTRYEYGGMVSWQGKNGTLFGGKPEGTEHIQGNAATARHVLTAICETANSLLKNEQKELAREMFLPIARRLARESKAFKAACETKEYQKLKIERDADALLQLLTNGEIITGPGFSLFVNLQSQDGGGGGLGGGGGVF
jgi:serine/threonine protein kinase